MANCMFEKKILKANWRNSKETELLKKSYEMDKVTIVITNQNTLFQITNLNYFSHVIAVPENILAKHL
jgi:hypothetical protein